MGDVHGQLEKVIGHLTGAGLIDDRGSWRGGEARLWFIGDLFDRGPDGLGSVDLVMNLQSEAAEAGGMVGALIGNHEVMLLAALNFQGEERGRLSFMDNWLSNGGVKSELETIGPSRLEWIQNRPAIIKIGETLLAHADSIFYLEYGSDIPSINSAIHDILTGGDRESWERLVVSFADRHVFDDPAKGGTERACRFLWHFWAGRLIHGHTPIDKVTGMKPKEIRSAFVYADGLCVNVDGGMYRGGPGFLYRAA